MPNELKIVIDADVNQAIAGVQNLSKVISSDFTKATNAASAAASNLSSSVASSIEKINNSLSSLKITSLDVNVNTSEVDASIKSIQSKFSTLVDPTLNILADTTQAEIRIKELISDLSTLKGSEVFIKANDTQALSAINEIESELKTILNKNIELTVDTNGATEASQKIGKLKNDINSLKSKSVVVPVDVNTDKAIAGIKKLTRDVDGLATGSIAQLKRAAAGLRTQLENLSPANLKSDFGKQLSGALKLVETNLKSLEHQSGVTGEKFEDVFKKLGRQVGDFATLIPAVAIGSLLASASGLVEDFIKDLFKGKMALSDFAKASSEALSKSGEESVKLEGLVSIARDVTLSTKERKLAIDQLQESYPGYLNNISLENINSKEAAKSIDALTESIFNKALADQFATLAAKKQVEIFEKIQKIRSLADLKGSTKEQAVADLASTGIRLENERLDKLIAERDDLKQAFKDAQIDFFDVFKKDPTKDLEKAKKEFDKFVDDTIARAKQFNKEFGNAFVVPDLEEGFFKSKKDVFKIALKELDDIKKGNLKIKLPVQTTFDLIPDNITPLTEAQLQELTKGFLQGIRVDAEIPLDVIFDPSLAPGSIDKINKKLDLRQQFKILGDIGLKEFDKIFKGIADTDFTGMNNGIKEATKRLQEMLELATTLNQAIGQGLVNAFNSVFDAILEGKNVFKVLGNAIKQLVVDTIKAVAQMLILRAITKLLLPGLPNGVKTGLGSGLINGAITGGRANFGGIGSTAFSNVIQIVGSSSISGDQIRTVYSRATGSSSNFG